MYRSAEEEPRASVMDALRAIVELETMVGT
jgi:hypothetical protein